MYTYRTSRVQLLPKVVRRLPDRWIVPKSFASRKLHTPDNTVRLLLLETVSLVAYFLGVFGIDVDEVVSGLQHKGC